MEKILIKEKSRLSCLDPPGEVPPGRYIRLESEEDADAFVLISRGGFLYKVRKKDLQEAMSRGEIG